MGFVVAGPNSKVLVADVDSLTVRYDGGTGFWTEVSRAMAIPA